MSGTTLFRLCLCYLLLLFSAPIPIALAIEPPQSKLPELPVPKAAVISVFNPQRPAKSDLPQRYPFYQYSSDESLMRPAREASAAKLRSQYDVESGLALSREFRSLIGTGLRDSLLPTTEVLKAFAESHDYDLLVLHAFSWTTFNNPTTFFFIAAGGIWQLELACDTFVFSRAAGTVSKLPRQTESVRMEYLTSAGHTTGPSARDRTYELAMREIARKLRDGVRLDLLTYPN